MKAIEYDRYGSPEVIELREVPIGALKRGEVRVSVQACGLNPKDALVRSGKFRRITGPRFPRRMGYDFCGSVLELGPGVSETRVGENVFGMLNGWSGGACAEIVTVPRNELAAAPAGIDPIKAAAIPLAALTALQALRNLGHVKAGSRVCINGSSGGVGTFAVQIAKILGAEVTAICSSSNDELMRSLGADHVVDYNQTPPNQMTIQFDCFFDVFGNQSLQKIHKQLRAAGRYITTVPNLVNVRNDLMTRWWPGKRGRLVIVKSRTEDLKLLAHWTEEDKLKPVIDSVFTLAEMRAAHMRIQTKHARGKIVLTP